MSEENQAILRRFIEEVWNKGNLALVDHLLTAGEATHSQRRGRCLRLNRFGSQGP
jgi:hypothetical protein